MSRSIEQVWRSIKDAARDYANRGIVPSLRDARTRVAVFVNEAGCDPAPPIEAMEFFAAELIGLSMEGFLPDSSKEPA